MLGLGATVVKHSPNAGLTLRERRRDFPVCQSTLAQCSYQSPNGAVRSSVVGLLCAKPQVGDGDRPSGSQEDRQNGPTILGEVQPCATHVGQNPHLLVTCFASWRHLSSSADGGQRRVRSAASVGRGMISTTVAFRPDLVGFVGSGGFSSSAAATTLMAAWFTW